MKTYAIIENNLVANIIAADKAFAAGIGAVELPDGFGIGDGFDGKNWTTAERPEPPPPPEPLPIQPPQITMNDLALAVAELAEKSEADKLETQLAIAEVAELATSTAELAMAGGEK